MSGIIRQAGGGQLTPEALQQHFKVPPKLHAPYVKTCAAGMKLMFDASTHQMVADYLKKPGPLGPLVGKGIADVVLYIFKESNQTLPPSVLVPAGMYLVAQAIDYIKKTGVRPISPQDEGQATQMMLGLILQKFHIDPDKMMSHIDQQGAAPQAAPAGA